jgi:AsmA protein
MKKFFKWLLIVLIAIVGLFTAVIIALPLLIDPNDFKDEITTAVKDQTGRTLKIEGDIKLSVFPWLGLQLGKTQLSNAPGFDQQPMLKLENIKLGVKLLPLLRQELQTDETILQGLKVNLQRKANGQSNWDDLTTTATKPDTSKSEDKKVSAAPLAAFAIGGLQLQDASIEWNDQQTQQHWQISNLDLSTGAIAWGKAFPLKLSLSAQAQHLKVRAELKLATNVTLYKTQQLRLQQLALEQRLWSPQLPSSPMTLQSKLNQLDFDPQGQTLKLKELQLQNEGLSIKANAAVDNLMSIPRYQAKITIPEFNPRQWLNRQKVALPKDLPAKALTRLQSQIHLTGSTQNLEVQRLEMTLDDSHLSGELSLPHLLPARYRYHLNLDKLDVDAYLPPKENKATATTPAAGAAAATQLPMDLLRSLDVDGTFDIGQLKASNLRLQKIETRLTASKGLLRLHPLRAQLYQGQYDGDIQLNAQGTQPIISTNERLQQLALGPLLKDFIGDDKFHGTTNLHAKLSTRGSDMDKLRQHLGGDLSTELKDGYLKGIDIDYAERKLRAQIKGEPIPPKPDKPQTGFSKLEAAFSVKNGIAQTRTLTAQLPHARMQGTGNIDLVKEQLDMTLNFKFSSDVQGQAGKSYEELDRVALPVYLRGPLSQPDYEIDYQTALKALVRREVDRKKAAEKAKLEQELQEEKARLEQKKQEEQQKLKEKVKQKANDFFKNLLNR